MLYIKREKQNNMRNRKKKIMTDKKDITPETAAAEQAEAEKKTVETPAQEQPAEKTEPTPEETIAALTAKLAEAENQRLLALAEMDNQRKRAAKERENLRANVEQDTLLPFLQVFEHFTMAVNAAEKAQNMETLLKGMEMIQAEFDKAFSELGVEKIDAMGKEFDPKLHEAVAQEPSETVPAGTVIKQWSFGFKSGDRLLKPAMVIVSSGKPE